MRETRQSGSEGGGAHALPTPILVDYKSRYKRGTCTSRNVIRSLPLPVPYLSTHVASLCSRPHALNGLGSAGWSRSLPPPQPGCPSGDPGPLPVPYLPTHVAEHFAYAAARALSGL
jgi:hypothetical protein